MNAVNEQGNQIWIESDPAEGDRPSQTVAGSERLKCCEIYTDLSIHQLTICAKINKFNKIVKKGQGLTEKKPNNNTVSPCREDIRKGQFSLRKQLTKKYFFI